MNISMSWKHFHMCLLCAPFTLANAGVEEMACSIISLKFLFLELHDNFNLKLKKGNLALIIFVIRKVTSWCSYPWSNSSPERLWLLLVWWSYVQNPHGSDLSLEILTALAPRLQFCIWTLHWKMGQGWPIWPFKCVGLGQVHRTSCWESKLQQLIGRDELLVLR